MISKRERRGYRVSALAKGRWGGRGAAGCHRGCVNSVGRAEALREAIAAVLEVPAEAFDVDPS
jgi:hypothetical protein